MRLRTAIAAAALAATAVFGSAGFANAQVTDSHSRPNDHEGDLATQAGESVSRTGQKLSQDQQATRAGESVSRAGEKISQNEQANRAGEKVANYGDQIAYDASGRIGGYDGQTGTTVFVDLPTLVRHLPARL